MHGCIRNFMHTYLLKRCRQFCKSWNWYVTRSDIVRRQILDVVACLLSYVKCNISSIWQQSRDISNSYLRHHGATTDRTTDKTITWLAKTFLLNMGNPSGHFFPTVKLDIFQKSIISWQTWSKVIEQTCILVFKKKQAHVKITLAGTSSSREE